MPSVIAAAFILYNLAKRLGDPDFYGDDAVDEDDDLPDLTDRTDNYLGVNGQEKRQQMAELYHNLYLYISMTFTLSRIMLAKVVFLFY